MAVSDRELRERLLRALEEDREFRYAVMGLVGYREVLERLAKLEERFAGLEEEFRRLYERQLRLEERQQKLEEEFRKLYERQLALEERQQRLEERMIRLEERMVKLEERQQKLEERMLELEKRVTGLEERMDRVEERLDRVEQRLDRVEEGLVYVRRLVEHTRRDVGALAEAFYSRVVWEELREELRERGERVLARRRGVVIGGYQVDLLVETRERVYVVEVKIQPNHHDVEELLRKAKAVGRELGKPVVPVLAGTWVGDEVRRYAGERGVHVLEY